MRVRLFYRPDAALWFVVNFALGVVWASSFTSYSHAFMAFHALCGSKELMRIFYLKVERLGE